MVDNIQVEWRGDGSATVIGRVTARNGSGAATGISGEGKFVQQADLSTITAKVFEKDADGVFVEITPAPTVTVATAILDTVDTTNEIWTVDTIGHNFIHDLGAVYFPNGGKIVKAEYKFTYVGGDVGWGVWEGPVRGVSSS